MDKEFALRIWDEIFPDQDYAYDYCSQKICREDFRNPDSEYSWDIDLIKPLSQGGSRNKGNLLPCSSKTIDRRGGKTAFTIDDLSFEVRKGRRFNTFTIYDVTDRNNPFDVYPSQENQTEEFNLNRQRRKEKEEKKEEGVHISPVVRNPFAKFYQLEETDEEEKKEEKTVQEETALEEDTVPVKEETVVKEVIQSEEEVQEEERKEEELPNSSDEQAEKAKAIQRTLLKAQLLEQGIQDLLNLEREMIAHEKQTERNSFEKNIQVDFLERLYKQITELHIHIDNVLDENDTLHEEIEKIKDENSMLKSISDTLKNEFSEKVERSNVFEQMFQSQRSFDNNQIETKTSSDKEDELRKNLSEELEKSKEKDEVIEELRRKIEKNEEERALLEERQNKLATELESYKNREEERKEKEEELLKKIEERETSIVQKEKENEELRAEIESYKNEKEIKDELSRKLAESQEKIDKGETTIEELQHELEFFGDRNAYDKEREKELLSKIEKLETVNLLLSYGIDKNKVEEGLDKLAQENVDKGEMSAFVDRHPELLVIQKEKEDNQISFADIPEEKEETSKEEYFDKFYPGEESVRDFAFREMRRDDKGEGSYDVFVIDPEKGEEEDNIILCNKKTITEIRRDEEFVANGRKYFFTENEEGRKVISSDDPFVDPLDFERVKKEVRAERKIPLIFILVKVISDGRNNNREENAMYLSLVEETARKIASSSLRNVHVEKGMRTDYALLSFNADNKGNYKEVFDLSILLNSYRYELKKEGKTNAIITTFVSYVDSNVLGTDVESLREDSAGENLVLVMRELVKNMVISPLIKKGLHISKSILDNVGVETDNLKESNIGGKALEGENTFYECNFAFELKSK